MLVGALAVHGGGRIYYLEKARQALAGSAGWLGRHEGQHTGSV